MKRYIPRINQASVPEEGKWALLETEPVLMLSVPEWGSEIHQSAEGIHHTWMYDRLNDAYLFCFRLPPRKEFAVAFPREHAGRLLRDERADHLFSLLITAKSLEGTADLRPCWLFRRIRLKRHPQAGW
jgi:hypothetical protein